MTNDPGFGSLWGMQGNFGSNAQSAWSAGVTGSKNVYVGIIDEGIDWNHPDLAANVWRNPFEIEGDGIDNDGNGYIDDIRGWDFANNDNSVYDGISDDHGTHVAGTIGAAGNNGLGVAGVNWNVTIIPVKFLGSTGGTLSGAIKAIDYLTDLKRRHGLNIVASNNSWGGAISFSQALQDAVTRAAKQDILFVAAAGNQSNNNDVTPFYPSSIDTTAGAGYDSVISVSGLQSDGSQRYNYGSSSVDLGAPAVGIYSTLPMGLGGYGTYSGTSMAAPHVTGAIALYASKYPTATAAQIKSALLASTTPTPSLLGKTVTGGRLNIANFLNTSSALPAPLPSPQPAPPSTPPVPAPPATGALPRPTSITALDLDGFSSSPFWEQVGNAFDNTVSSKYLNAGGTNSGLEFSYAVPTKITSFVISTANDVPERDPASYQLYGLNGGNWQLLTSGALQLPAARLSDGPTVVLPDLPMLSQYRVIFPTLKASGQMMQIAELKLYGNQSSTPAPAPTPPAPTPPAPAPDPIIGLTPNQFNAIDLDGFSSSPYWEQVNNAFDNNTGTKYLNAGGINSGIEFSYATAAKLSSFSITTANDVPGRDPASYKLFGCNAAGNWDLISAGGITLPMNRFASGATTALQQNGATYQKYRMIFDALRGGSNQMMQISELKLFGQLSGASTANELNVFSTCLDPCRDLY